ncbi:MAG: hypothetical protein AAFX96_10100 [Pseudomonadota bacterium]
MAGSGQERFDDDVDCQEDSSYLERIYDLKSWDMFHRITQARKQREDQRRLAAAAAGASDEPSQSSVTVNHVRTTASKPTSLQSSAANVGTGHQIYPKPSTFLPSEALPPHQGQGVLGSVLSRTDGPDDQWENLGLDYDDDYTEKRPDNSESQLIFLFDL